MWTPRASALVLIGVAAQSLVLDGWQVFEARNVPLAVAMLAVAVALVAGSGRPSKRRAGSWAPRNCPSCGASLSMAAPEIVGNMFMVLCPRGCGMCNVIGPRVERPPTRDPDVLHDERCEGDCGGCRVSRGVN